MQHVPPASPHPAKSLDIDHVAHYTIHLFLQLYSYKQRIDLEHLASFVLTITVTVTITVTTTVALSCQQYTTPGSSSHA
jgi:hypothetical protein